MICADFNILNQGRLERRVLAAIRTTERQTETRHWSEDKNSPRLGPENRLGSTNPHVAPRQGAL